MNKGPNFLSIKDLMTLMGTVHYNTAQVRHKAIRDSIMPGKKGLTIREYCKAEGYDFEEVWAELRGRGLKFNCP